MPQGRQYLKNQSHDRHHGLGKAKKRVEKVFLFPRTQDRTKGPGEARIEMSSY